MKRLYLFFILGFITLGSDALACCGKKKSILPVIDLADTYTETTTKRQDNNDIDVTVTLYTKAQNGQPRTEIGVATAEIKHDTPTQAFISLVEVPLPTHRKLGCGTKLLKAMIDQLYRHFGCQKIELTAQPINVPLNKKKERQKTLTWLIAFYNKYGFNVTKRNDKDDTARMERVFDRPATPVVQDDDKKSFDPVATVAAE